jgi:hypothetical protein
LGERGFSVVGGGRIKAHLGDLSDEVALGQAD